MPCSRTKYGPYYSHIKAGVSLHQHLSIKFSSKGSRNTKKILIPFLFIKSSKSVNISRFLLNSRFLSQDEAGAARFSASFIVPNSRSSWYVENS